MESQKNEYHLKSRILTPEPGYFQHPLSPTWPIQRCPPPPRTRWALFPAPGPDPARTRCCPFCWVGSPCDRVCRSSTYSAPSHRQWWDPPCSPSDSKTPCSGRVRTCPAALVPCSCWPPASCSWTPPPGQDPPPPPRSGRVSCDSSGSSWTSASRWPSCASAWSHQIIFGISTRLLPEEFSLLRELF